MNWKSSRWRRKKGECVENVPAATLILLGDATGVQVFPQETSKEHEALGSRPFVQNKRHHHHEAFSRQKEPVGGDSRGRESGSYVQA
jgi:hypothetical protein